MRHAILSIGLATGIGACGGAVHDLGIESSETLGIRTMPWHRAQLPTTNVRPGEAVDFALYADRGAWDTGVEHLKMFFVEHGLTYRTLSAADILGGVLARDQIAAVVMPGGGSWTYLADLGNVGAQAIRAFVAAGGGYIGICAGAYYATAHREGGVTTGPYGIGLLEGTAYDGTALGTAPFKDGMLDFPLDLSGLFQGFGARYRIVLFGGPSFHYDASEAAAKSLQVLSRFQGIGEPAMIAFNYGAGHVFLSGPHLEIEEDRTDWGDEFKDPESDWPLLRRVAGFVRDGVRMSATKN